MMMYEIAYALDKATEMRTCVRQEKGCHALLQEQNHKTPLKNNMCTEGPNGKQYIMKGYTEDQAGQDIRAEDVIQAANLVWYMRAEIRTWQDKTTAGIPTYGNCTKCYWGGPVGMVCTHCVGKGKKRPTYQVVKVEHKILD